jgi:hypothetical protein
MGGSFVGGTTAILCDGKDVAKNLKKVFLKPGSNEYKAAKANKQKFLDVANGAGDYVALYDAYTTYAGVAPCDTWKYYLSTLAPAEIIQIAQARFDGLSTDAPMKISTHNPKKNGDHHVHVSSDPEDGTITIDSPLE